MTGAFILPVTYLSEHDSNHVADPDIFAPEEWIGTRKTAVMPGAGYLSFGLGRWACPGRFLAVIGKELLHLLGPGAGAQLS